MSVKFGENILIINQSILHDIGKNIETVVSEQSTDIEESERQKALRFPKYGVINGNSSTIHFFGNHAEVKKFQLLRDLSYYRLSN